MILNDSTQKLSHINVGETIKLGLRIQEGKKTRIQYYKGILIAKKNSGLNKTLTLRRMSKGIGFECSFFINSPKIESFKIQNSSKIRRSKLYFLRDRSKKLTNKK